MFLAVISLFLIKTVRVCVFCAVVGGCHRLYEELVIETVADVPVLRLLGAKFCHSCHFEQAVQCVRVGFGLKHVVREAVLVAYELFFQIYCGLSAVERRGAEPLVQAVVIIEVVLVGVAQTGYPILDMC